jgi:bifunctional DNA-binding transcriptional regulator/antitoxin component of YhaV-PrlF toxin-antitoxin module
MATTTKSEELIAHLRATTMTVTLGAEGGLTLSEKIRRVAGLSEGDMVYVEVEDKGEGGMEVRLGKIDPDQAWFWTPEWQATDREADAEFLAALKQWSKDADV